MPPIVEKFAVLLIDSHKTDESEVPDLKAELDNMSAVLQQANISGVSVYEIRPCDIEQIVGKVCQLTNPVLTNLSASNWRRLDKMAFDAFDGTDLKQNLEVDGVTSLVVMGYHEAVCVKATIETAIQSGYLVYTSMDVVQCGKYDEYSSNDKNAQEEVKKFYSTRPILLEKFSELPIFEITP